MKRDNNYLIGNEFAKGQNPNESSFKKGNRPWNKDKKGLHLSPATEFKKGHKSHNRKPVGTITQRIDKNNKIRNWIKISEPNIWTEYAKYVWIKNNGNIPTGLVTHHIDENTLNDDITNLKTLTRAAHMKVHKISRWTNSLPKS